MYWSKEPTNHYTIDNFNPMHLSSIDKTDFNVVADVIEDDARSTISSLSDDFNQADLNEAQLQIRNLNV